MDGEEKKLEIKDMGYTTLHMQLNQRLYYQMLKDNDKGEIKYEVKRD